MEIRFCNGATRSPIDARLPADCPVPRVGDAVVLPDARSGDVSRWLVKSVVWDYSREVSVEVTVTSLVPAPVPSFAAYGD